MSGHSKWATTHRQKEATDKKRSSIFTRLARLITIAARESGGDPNSNFKLRMAIDKAKQANMPKDNIEKAIKRGTGEIQGETIEEITYEAIGPENTALLIQVLTDNKNRTLASIKNILTKNNGKLAGAGSVSWMFEQKGVIEIPNKNQVPDLDEFQLSLIESGAEDFQESENTLTVYTAPTNLQKTKEKIESQNIKISSAQIEFVPKKENLLAVAPQSGTKARIEQLLNILTEQDDVQEIYTNLK